MTKCFVWAQFDVSVMDSFSCHRSPGSNLWSRWDQRGARTHWHIRENVVETFDETRRAFKLLDWVWEQNSFTCEQTACLWGIWMLEKQLKRTVFSPNPKELNLYYKADRRKVGGQLVSCQGQDQTVQWMEFSPEQSTNNKSFKSLMNSCRTEVKSPLQEHQILFNKENGCLKSFLSSHKEQAELYWFHNQGGNTNLQQVSTRPGSLKDLAFFIKWRR